MVQRSKRLKKDLSLFDVYAICTGAMFSSGFFLLPGLAAAYAGPSVILAYLIAGILILPAMFSKAELSTALPRAGGTYYFLDRSLGPMVGTVGGLGTFLALALKSAFALIGMGAYLAIFVAVPIKPLAIGLTVAFMGINIVGAKETSALQRIFVIILVVILSFFTVQGLVEVGGIGWNAVYETQLQPFMPFGWKGLFATVGLVFVSYAGLTKVASVAEEVRNPDRDIPLGMGLSLLTATTVYVLGVFIMVAVLDPTELRDDLTPVATAGEAFFDWLPQPLGLILIVVAAIAAFASTGNAGMMSGSRYPFAMARDRLISGSFARMGRFQTPVRAILLTGGLMIASILFLDVASIAKLASAFQLLIFLLINVAVIVMRESRIQAYDPGFRSPFYPWMQIAGVFIPVVLIALMGWMPILFTLGVVIVCLMWYAGYARSRVVRDGAIYHWFERLGRRRYEGLEPELRGILKERGLREQDPYDEVVADAAVLDFDREASFESIVERSSAALADRVPRTASEIADEIMQGTKIGATPVTLGVALPHILVEELDRAQLVLVRARKGVCVRSDSKMLKEAGGWQEEDGNHKSDETEKEAFALFFLASPKDKPGQHLRVLAKIAESVDRDQFIEQWLTAPDADALKSILLRDERSISLRVSPEHRTSQLIGKPLGKYDWPEGCLVAAVRRDGHSFVPNGGTVLLEGDRLTIIGNPEGIASIRDALYAD